MKFEKVFDSRNRRVRGAWMRDGIYYVQMRVPGIASPKRLPQPEIKTVPELIKEIVRLKDKRGSGTLNVVARLPKLSDFIDEYLRFWNARVGASVKEGVRFKTKRGSTLKLEEFHLADWKAAIGHKRLNEIVPLDIREFVDKRIAKGASPRTADLAVVCLNNVFRLAADPEHHSNGRPMFEAQWPTRFYKRRAAAPLPRPMWSKADIDKLADEALNARSDRSGQLRDFILLGAFCGAREQELLHLRWGDVDFDGKILNIVSRDGFQTKNSLSRTVNFNAELEAHLREMQARRQGTGEFLFPSARTLKREGKPQTHFRTAFNACRERAGLKDVEYEHGKANFETHDLRHFFASKCLMAGVDIQTVAAWLGHKDKGLTLAKTYAHLLDDHKKQMATKVCFGPMLMEKAG